VVKSAKSGDACPAGQGRDQGEPRAGPYDVIILACKGYDLDSADGRGRAGGRRRHDHRADPERPCALCHARCEVRRGESGGRTGAHLRYARPERRDPAQRGQRRVVWRARAKPARASLVELDAACKKAGIEGGLNPNIDQDLWDKWIMLGAIASMCSAMRGSIGDIMASEDGEAIMNEILEECRQVAAAAGHAPSEKALAAVRGGLTQKGGKAVASILGDMEKGGAVEGKQIVGDMLARARRAGIAAPNLRFAYAHLQTYEARRARGALK
jgi:2-dehydropantoate 2-reductase